MKDNLMQKMCDVFESIIKSEGATALIDEKIRKCCEENGVDYDEFSVSVLEEILSIIGAHSDDVGDMLPSELSSKDLDAVSGGTGFFRRGTASALAALSLCGATQLPASAGKQTNHHDASKRATSRHVPDRREPYTINKSQPATNFVTNLATFALGSFLTYFFMHKRSGGPETTSPKLTDLAKNLLPVNGDGISKNPLLQGNGFLPENNGLHEDSFKGKFKGTNQTYSFRTDISATRGYHPFRVGVLNNTLDYCCEKLGFKIKGKKIGSHLNDSQYADVLWELPPTQPAPVVITEQLGSAEVTKSFDPEKCAKIWLSNGRSLQTMVAVQRMSGGSFNTQKTALLNFANYFTPGGGVLKGCVAQEESICRITTLYPLLRNASVCKNFYDINNTAASTHHGPTGLQYWRDIGVCERCVYVPNVQQIKNDYGAGRINGFIYGLIFNVITAAAPQLTKLDSSAITTLEYRKIIKDLWRQIIALAFYKNNENLIAGALGCGAFGNDPKVVAETFFDVLMNEGPIKSDHAGERWIELFKNIVLPIYVHNCSEADVNNYNHFFNKVIEYACRGLNIQLLNLYCPE